MKTLTAERRNIVLITVLVFILMLFIPGFIGVMYLQADQNLTEQVYSQQQTLTGLAASAVTIKLNHLVDIATSLASLSAVSQDAASGHWNDAAQVANDQENNVVFYDPFIDRIVFYDAAGTQQSAYPALQGGIGSSAASSSWYQSFAANPQESSYVSGAVERLSLPRIDVINMAVPIQTGTSTDGFLVLQIPTSNFLEFGTDLSMGTYGFAYIVDAKGDIIAHPQYSSQDGMVVSFASIPAVQEIMAGRSGIMIATDQNDNEQSVVTYQPLGQYHWGIVTQELSSEVFAVRDSILSIYLIAMAVTLGFDILFSWLIFTLLTAEAKHQKK